MWSYLQRWVRIQFVARSEDSVKREEGALGAGARGPWSSKGAPLFSGPGMKKL